MELRTETPLCPLSSVRVAATSPRQDEDRERRAASLNVPRTLDSAPLKRRYLSRLDY